VQGPLVHDPITVDPAPPSIAEDLAKFVPVDYYNIVIFAEKTRMFSVTV